MLSVKSWRGSAALSWQNCVPTRYVTSFCLPSYQFETVAIGVDGFSEIVFASRTGFLFLEICAAVWSVFITHCWAVVGCIQYRCSSFWLVACSDLMSCNAGGGGEIPHLLQGLVCQYVQSRDPQACL